MRLRKRSYIVYAAFTVIVFVSLTSFLLEQITISESVYQRRLCSVETIKEKNQTERVDLSNELVDSMIMYLNERSVFLDSFWELDFNETREALRFNLSGARYLDEIGDIRFTLNDVLSWTNFVLNINEYYIYDWRDDGINDMLKAMSTLRPEKIDQHADGYEMKFNFHFHEKFWANAKPMRLPREAQSNPNHFVLDEFERHTAEIAAFHLDRVLGFCRVPPTTGRYVNLTEFRKAVPPYLYFFTSPVGNTCFYGNCGKYCNAHNAFCGQGDILEFSQMVYIPPKLNGLETMFHTDNPYKPAYSRDNKAIWEVNANFCKSVKRVKPYNERAALLNLIETHIFDFLTGNRDRHTIDYFVKFGTTSIPILYDNGQGFGTSDRDYTAILAPLRQCCQIKKSTLLKFIKLYKGPDKLSDLMNDSLRFDPLAPVLLQPHLDALDRRVVVVLKAVAECLLLGERSYNEVVFEDV